MYFSQGPGHGIYLAGAAKADSMQLDSRALSALAKQRADFAHGMSKAARNIGRDLGLLQHPAVFADHSQRQLCTSDVNRSDHGLSLSRKRTPGQNGAAWLD